MYAPSPNRPSHQLSALLAPVPRKRVSQQRVGRNPAATTRSRTTSSVNRRTASSTSSSTALKLQNNNRAARGASSSFTTNNTTRNMNRRTTSSSSALVHSSSKSKTSSSSSSAAKIQDEYAQHNRERQRRKKVMKMNGLVLDDENEPSVENAYYDHDEKDDNNEQEKTTKKQVRFDDKSDDGGDVADSSSHNNSKRVAHQNSSSSSNTNISRALVKFNASNGGAISTSIIYNEDPQIDTIVKRRLGQENSNRIRLARTLTQVEQDLSLARKEHRKLSTRSNAIPRYQEELISLREDCETLRDDLENLDIEYAYFQQRYRDIDMKLDPVENVTVRNKKKLEAQVRENRAHQMNAAASSLHKKEKLLIEEIKRLTEQRQRAIEMERQAARQKSLDDAAAAESGSPVRMREESMKKALDAVRQEHASKRAMAMNNLHTQIAHESKKLAEEEIIRETQESKKFGDYRNELNKAESDNTNKKHEVVELTQRQAQATARLQELNADLAVEQKRLSQSRNALTPAQEELESLQKLIESSQEHLELQAVGAKSDKESKEQSQNAANHAWQIELEDLERTLASLDKKVKNLREENSVLSKDLESQKKKRDNLENTHKKGVADLLAKSQKAIETYETSTGKTQAEISKFNSSADKLEQEAHQLEQRVGASQKTEIIMQLQRQNGELQGQVDSLTKGNNKLEEKLKKSLTMLGDDVLL